MTGPLIIPIQNSDDLRIADYMSVRERDLTGREGKFIIEGKVTLNVALTRSDFVISSLFLETGRLTTLTDLLSKLPESIPVYTADQSIMDQIVGFPIHRGILACGLKRPQPVLNDWLDQLTGESTLVVCAGLSNHDNVGAIFRNAAALGADGILLDAESCDPLYRKSIRVSAGTALWLPFYHADTADTLLDHLKSRDFKLWTLTPSSEATALYATQPASKNVIVLGAEGPGLPASVIAKGKPVAIPMQNNVDSLNVATALAVTLSWMNAQNQITHS